MFEYLNGVIRYKKAEYVAIDVNGVGYKVYITLKTYDKLKVGEKVEIYIHNVIKEDCFKLVGFLQERERTLFEMLINISGIGVSLALAILSTFSVDNIREIVLTEDFKTLKRVPKLGEKKSKQVIIDLNNRMKTLNLLSMEEPTGDLSVLAVEEELYMALESLGYSKKEIESIVKKDEIKQLKTVEEAIKAVLKRIKIKSEK